MKEKNWREEKTVFSSPVAAPSIHLRFLFYLPTYLCYAGRRGKNIIRTSSKNKNGCCNSSYSSCFSLYYLSHQLSLIQEIQYLTFK